MIKKLQVIVREVYEDEVMEDVIRQNKTGVLISEYDYNKLPKEEQENYIATPVSSGKSKIEISENDPIFGQIFSEEDLNVKELILHLNRTK